MGIGAADSTRPASWNRLAYSLGDPINLGDSTGNAPCDPDPAGANPCSALAAGGDGGLAYGDENGVVFCGGDLEFDYLGAATNPACYAGVGDETAVATSAAEDPSPVCPPKFQNFINNYGADAIATGLSEANVLALSSIESDWGNGRFAKGGNSFFNLETLAPKGWVPGDPFPKTIYADQASWMNALEPFATGPFAGRYSLVATYQNASDAFKSFAAKDGQFFSGVADAAAFGKIAVAHGIYAGRGQGFIKRERTFQDCLASQKQ